MRSEWVVRVAEQLLVLGEPAVEVTKSSTTSPASVSSILPEPRVPHPPGAR